MNNIEWNSEINTSESTEPVILDDLDSMDNIYPIVRRTYITNENKAFVKTLRDESLRICRESIDPKYTKRMFKKFKEGFLYNDEIGRRLAFCIWKVEEILRKDGRPSKYVLNLLLICSRHQSLKLGRNMFFDLDNYCKEKGIETIKLQPVNSKIEEHYKTYGFVTLPKFNEDDATEMAKNVYTSIAIKKTIKNKSPTQQTRKKSKIIDYENMDYIL
jgi:hypothetical protein